MATLTSTKIKNTYDALLKASDNDAIGSSAKQITDGLGNGTPLYISTTQIGIGVTPEATFDLHVYQNAKVGGNLTITGDLTVNGTTTTVGTDTLSVKDPLIVLANNNTSADSVDIGFYGKYAPSGTTLYAGLFRDTGDNKFKIFRDLEDEPTTTVNTSGTGYTVATLVGNVEGTLTGVIASTTTATTQSANDNSTKVATTAYVDTSAGNYLPLAGGTMSGSIAMGGNNISGGGTATFTSFVGDLTGNADTATALETARTIQVSGDVAGSASFDGTADINISTTIQPNSVALGTDTTGNYVATISGTANEITVSDSGSESAAVTISLPSSISVDVTGDLTGDVYNADGSIIFNTGDDSNDGFLVDGVRATTQSQGDNSTKIATTAYVDSAIGGQDTLAEILANGNTTGGTDIIVSTSDQIFLPDGSVTNPAISFSNDTDSGIYHSGTQFIIAHAGSNKMIIANSQVTLEDRLIVNDTINADDGILIEGASNPYLSIHDETNETYTALWSGDTEAALTFSHSLFRITSSTNNFTGTDLVTITSGGNVGINDISPSGAAGYTYLTINNASNGAAISFKESSTERAAIYYTNSSNLFNIYATETGSQLVFGTNAAESMRIDSSGNLLVTKQSANNATVGNQFMTDGSANSTVNGDTVARFNRLTSDGEIIRLQKDTSTVGSIGSTTSYLSGSLGIGITNPQSNLHISTSSTNAPIRLQNDNGSGSTANFVLQTDSSGLGNNGFGIYDVANSEYRLVINGSGNVGIGTDSPNAFSNQTSLTINGTNNGRLDLKVGNAQKGAVIATANEMILDAGASPMQFYTGNTLHMLINTSGNVGIGVTPYSHYTGYEALDIGNTTALISNNTGTNVTNLLQNAYLNSAGSAWTYKYTDEANQFYMANGEFNFENAPSGTAGSAITWTRRLTIQANGNVGIGLTNPASKLEVYGNVQSDTISIANSAAYIRGADVGIAIGQSASSPYGTWIQSLRNTDGVTFPMSLNPNGGNVGIGTTSPLTTLDLGINGGQKFYVYANGSIRSGMGIDLSGSSRELSIFHTSSNNIDGDISLGLRNETSGQYVERMRIQGNGNVGINFTSPSSKLYVKGSSSVVAGRFWGEAGTVAPLELAQNSGGGFLAKFYSDTFSTVCGSISHSGSATAFNTSSDYRLKENVVEMTGALDRVEQLKPSRFNFRGHEEIVDGFLAHEVSDIVPEAITGTKDEVDAEGNPVYQGIDQSKLVPLLVGAIKELKAEIETLKAQINN